MTAIVGILNKKAAVMAADRALTVTRGDSTRIYNNASKIFKLSSKYPVAVMIYNNTSFMGVPVNVIINLYNEREGDKGFKNLNGYVENFIKYLDKETCFRDDKCQHSCLRKEMMTYYTRIKDFVANEINSDIEAIQDNLTDKGKYHITEKHVQRGINELTEMITGFTKSQEFERYPFKKFREYAKEDMDEFMKIIEDEGVSANIRNKFEKGLYEYICSNCFYNGTGLVFVGYGTDEIFPSLIPVFISGVFDGRLRYYCPNEAKEIISNENEATIVPFAQTDVMMTIMEGISPSLKEKVSECHHNIVDHTKSTMIDALKTAGVDEKTIAKVVNAVDKTTDEYDRQIEDFIQNESIDGLVETVESFDVDDMAHMAESLIEITNLQRHITGSEETVGGQVDVAVLTKDRGFVWLKSHDWIKSV